MSGVGTRRTTVMAMFPLGSVLFPWGMLPLRIFEPRYRAMLRDVQSDELGYQNEFGVVLIERGSEVGGGDVRHTVGTRARIVQIHELADGSSLVACIGTGRISVEKWLPDDPYPRAQVSVFDDGEGDGGGVGIESEYAGPVADVIAQLRRSLALHTELGDETAPATIEFDEQNSVALWQACAIAPIGPADDYRLLTTTGISDRIELLRTMLVEDAEVLAHRLGDS